MSEDERDAMHAMFEEARQKMEAHNPEPPFIADPNKLLTVRKMVAYWPISDEALHPERYPVPAIPWRRRMLWRWLNYQDRLRLAWDVLRDRHDCRDDY